MTQVSGKSSDESSIFLPFRFFSFEHYPCGAGGGEGKICADWSSLYWEPAYVNHLIQAWKDNGLPRDVPFYMTEGNDLEDGGPETVKRGLWLADYVGSMLTAGASGTYYFHYIASINGGDGFLPVDGNGRVTYYPPQYLATEVIAKDWVQPVDGIHKLFKTSSEVNDGNGNTLVTAYTMKRPDGKWSIMLINKDRDHEHVVKVRFDGAENGKERFFSGPVDRIVFGPAQYQWHADPGSNAGDADPKEPRHRRSHGHPAPDGPPSETTLTSSGADTTYVLPKASIIVLRGQVQ